jgi:heat shock protein HspQ
MSDRSRARFSIGEIVDHQLFGYRGVIFDVDATFQQSEDWYQNVAKSRPPKDQPWYHVLPDGATHSTYVAERNLEPATAPRPINHPLVDAVFTEFDGSRYSLRQNVN